MNIEVSIQGFEDVMTSLENFTDEFVTDIYKIIAHEMITGIENHAASEAPVRTGFLRRSAYAEAHKTYTGFSVSGGFFAKYAQYVDNTHPTKAGFISENVVVIVNNISRRIKEALDK